MEYKGIKVGDTIRDVEDGDCYFEGIVVEVLENGIKYKVDRVLWNDEERLTPEEDRSIGTICYDHWYFLEKKVGDKWIQV
jgi:hypothetical protein